MEGSRAPPEPGERFAGKIPQRGLGAPGDEPERMRRVGTADPFAGEPARGERRADFGDPGARNREQEPEARERDEPPLEGHAGGLRQPVELERRAEARRLEKHEQGPRDPGIAHVLAGVDAARRREGTEDREITSEALSGALTGGVEEREVSPVGAAQIGREKNLVPG